MDPNLALFLTIAGIIALLFLFLWLVPLGLWFNALA
jgi:uncharacterized protein YqfA (UPF0365 family)